MSINKQDFITQTQGLIKYMDELCGRLAKARKETARAKIDYVRAQEVRDDLATRLIIEIAESEDIRNSVDPRTGKANADWAKMKTQLALQEHPVFIEASKNVHGTDELYHEKSVDEANLADQLGTTRVESRILSALMELLGASEGD